MDAEKVKEAVKAIVLAFAPDAEVILFGSRARGDAEPDSDWDFLVLLPLEPTRELQQKIRRSLYEWEWENGEVITSMYRSKKRWDSPLMRVTPLHRNVAREGIRL